MIIGKTRIEQNYYDCLVFCIRNVKHIKIPSFIEHIYSYSFDHCNQLESIEFSNDSKLQTIDEYAFTNSAIKNITIPPSVAFIGKYAFEYCDKLQRVEFPNDSKIQTIEEKTFILSSIESITIPSNLIDLKKNWCINVSKLITIKVSSNNPRYYLYDDKMIIGKTRIEQNYYDCLVFCIRNVKHIKIPSFIEHICSCSFDNCNQLESVDIPNDSKLQTIDEYSFSRSKLKKITIPSSVTFIGECAFYLCIELKGIEIPNDSKLQTIDKMSFYHSTIGSIIIPSSVTFIGEDALTQCEKLQIIEINNLELMLKYKSCFEECQNVIIMIPFHS